MKRNSRSVRRFSRGGKDYIWCTTRVDQVVLDDELVSISTLLSPSDWEASTTGFDRGTLVSIRGWLSTQQGAAGTTNDATLMAMYVVKNSSAAASTFSPLLASSYDNSDVLWSSGLMVTGTPIRDNSRMAISTQQIDIKSKRKVSSGDVIQLVSAMDIDTASPTMFVGGFLRCLVQRA